MARIPITCLLPTGVTPSGTPDRFRRWAGKIGPNTEGLIAAVLASRRHPEQGFRTCLGILRLYRGVDPERAEAVSARALEIGALACKSIASLLARKRDRPAAKTALKPRSSITPIYVAPAITIERNAHACPSDTRTVTRTWSSWLAKGFKELEHKAEARAIDHAEWLGLLLEYETNATPAKTVRNARQSRAPASCRRRRRCRLPEPTRARSRFVPQTRRLRLDRRNGRNLLITGASGLGKSWLACALGHKACRENMSVLYTRMPRLFADLEIAHGDARYGRLLRSIARINLLILDDWGRNP